MASILLSGPAAEPLTLAEAKQFLRVEYDDDDDLIETLISVARAEVEAKTRRALITQQWRIVRTEWPPDGRISANPAPLREVLAARVYDADNVAHTIDLQAFVIEPGAGPGVIGFVPWALVQPGRGVAGIELDVECGYGDAAADVPEPLRQAIRMLVTHRYENRGFDGGVDAGPASLEALIAPYRVLSL